MPNVTSSKEFGNNGRATRARDDHIRKSDAYVIYRVLTRLDEQAADAIRHGRDGDAHELCKLIGRLEYHIFECVGFEHALERRTA